jgi:hypothetical protein
VDVDPALVELGDHGGGDVRQAAAVAGPDEVGEVPHVLGQRDDLGSRDEDHRELEMPGDSWGGAFLENLIEPRTKLLPVGHQLGALG